MPLLDRSSSLFIELVADEIGRRYPETGEDYARKLLRAHTEGNLVGFGRTTLGKRIIACYSQHDLVGFTVLSLKAHGMAKLGPTIVLPAWRGRRLGVLLRLVASDIAAKNGVTRLLATCGSANHRALTSLTASGFSRHARLRDHYRAGEVEIALVKHLPSAPSRYSEDVSAAKLLAPLSGTDFAPKRGGSVRVWLPSRALRCQHSNNVLLGILEDLLDRNLARSARRVYMIVPSLPALERVLSTLGFVNESLGPPSSTAFGAQLYGLLRDP